MTGLPVLFIVAVVLVVVMYLQDGSDGKRPPFRVEQFCYRCAIAAVMMYVGALLYGLR